MNRRGAETQRPIENSLWVFAPLVQRGSAGVSLLQAVRERLRRFARTPPRSNLQRFHRSSLIEVYHRLELVGEPRVEVVADPLRFREIDHSNRALKLRCAQYLREKPVVPKEGHELRYLDLVKQGFIAARQRGE